MASNYKPGQSVTDAWKAYQRVNAAKPGAHNAYAVGDKVTHDGKTWISMVDNNVWEPGAADVYENIWKGVI